MFSNSGGMVGVFLLITTRKWRWPSHSASDWQTVYSRAAQCRKVVLNICHSETSRQFSQYVQTCRNNTYIKSRTFSCTQFAGLQSVIFLLLYATQQHGGRLTCLVTSCIGTAKLTCYIEGNIEGKEDKEEDVGNYWMALKR
jgi:hypothetical protein